ncbi:hypothetical protein LAY57_25775 [Argonema antarcticum A004/B2]|nr:hypothetical protein [Argonema antarcticum A004/B2]
MIKSVIRYVIWKKSVDLIVKRLLHYTTDVYNLRSQPLTNGIIFSGSMRSPAPWLTIL